MSTRKIAALLIAHLTISGSIGGATAAEQGPRLHRILAAQPPALSSVDNAARLRERTRLLAQGEAALAKADVGAALKAFDAAAGILHSADTELGLVRTYMQNGDYRRATAFAAHTAQAHRDTPGATALYAWLLYVGGQGAQARRILNEAEKSLPQDQTLALTRRQLDSPAPVARGALLQPPARMAPFGPAPGLPAKARTAGTGVLVDNGKRAVVPLSTVNRASTVWLRDGLGRFSRAMVTSRAQGIAIVALEHPMAAEANLRLADADPFPGSVAFAIGYVASADATPSWPLLTAGFIGRPSSDGAQLLGIELFPGARGGPVFSAAGRLVGFAIAGGDGSDFLVPASHLRAATGAALPSEVVTPASQRMPADQIYEVALRTAVQVILAP